MALAIASTLPRLSSRRPVVVLTLLLAAAAIAARVTPLDKRWQESARALSPWLAGAAACTGCATWLARRRFDAAIAALGVGSLALFLGVDVAASHLSPWFSARDVALAVRRDCSGSRTLVNWGTPHRYSVAFYSGVLPVQVGSGGELAYGFRLAAEIGRRFFPSLDLARAALNDMREACIVADERDEATIRAELGGRDVDVVLREGGTCLLVVRDARQGVRPSDRQQVPRRESPYGGERAEGR
jgi:hypothetical protein